ncbi:MAG: LEPR-XLL domain-containing protein [Planctomycetota bacterium]
MTRISHMQFMPINLNPSSGLSPSDDAGAASVTRPGLFEALEPRVLLSAVQAQSVDDFIDSIGINIKLDRSAYDGANYAAKIEPALQDLGIRHYRDGLKLVENAGYRSRYQGLYDNFGMQMLGVWGPFEDPNGTPERAPDVAMLGGDFVLAIAGPNEPDVFGQPSYNGFVDDGQFNDGDPPDYAASRAYQNDLYAELKAEPLTQGLPVLTPAMAFSESVRYITPVDHDVIAAHRYTGYQSATFGINNWFSRTREWNGDNPIWITEAGHVTTPNLNTPQSVSERAQGVYIPRLLVEYFSRGVERTYLHQLSDLFTSDTQDTANWGLIRPDGSAKPSYNALDGLIDLLNEGTWDPQLKEWATPSFTPDEIEVTYTKANNQIKTPVLLQKSDGALYFLTYRDVDVFDGLTNDGDGKGDITYGTINLTMGFLDDVASVTHYRFDDSGNLLDAGASVNGKQVTVGVSDEMSIIEVRLTEAGVYQQDAGAEGIVSIEAENYSGIVGGLTDDWLGRSGGSGGSHLEAGPDSGNIFNSNFVGNAPRVDFTVNFVQTGTHYLWVRGKAGGSSIGGSDSLHVGLNGQARGSADRINGFDGDFGWSNATMDGPIATLEITDTGEQSVSVWMREDGIDVDKIVLTTSDAFDPGNGEGPAESPRLVATPLIGDYNADGFVGQGDLNLVLSNWGSTELPDGFAESNLSTPFSGVIGQTELNGVLTNWGSSQASTPVSGTASSQGTAAVERSLPAVQEQPEEPAPIQRDIAASSPAPEAPDKKASGSLNPSLRTSSPDTAPVRNLGGSPKVFDLAFDFSSRRAAESNLPSVVERSSPAAQQQPEEPDPIERKIAASSPAPEASDTNPSGSLDSPSRTWSRSAPPVRNLAGSPVVFDLNVDVSDLLILPYTRL